MIPLLADQMASLATVQMLGAPVMLRATYDGDTGYIYAWQQRTPPGSLWLQSLPSLNAAVTDAAPALAITSAGIVYLAWKTAGKTTIQIMSIGLGQPASDWQALAPPPPEPGVPPVATDASPALAIAGNGELYLVWKELGSNAALAYASYDGMSWSTPTQLIFITTNLAPAAAGCVIAGETTPLCLAWTDSMTQSATWSLVSPEGARAYAVPGSASDAPPSLTPSTTPNGYYLLWKIRDASTVSAVYIDGNGSGDVLLLSQIDTVLTPAAVNVLDRPHLLEGPGFEQLVVTWQGASSALPWQGTWTIPSNAADSPIGGLIGSSNYYIHSDCKVIENLVVTVEITQDIVSSGGFSFQLNTLSAPGYQCAYQQYCIFIGPSAQAEYEIDNFSVSFENICAYDGLMYQFAVPTLPAGTKLVFELEQNEDGTVIGVIFQIINYAENIFVTRTPALGSLKYLPAPSQQVPLSGMAPITAFQFVLVGSYNSLPADLSSGAGTITYSATTPLYATGTRPICTQGVAVTAESSQALYDYMPTAPSTKLTQNFLAIPPVQ